MDNFQYLSLINLNFLLCSGKESFACFQAKIHLKFQFQISFKI